MTAGSQAPQEKIRVLRRSVYSDAILDAAERCFFESGFAETKMAEVAARAGVSVGTLYKHFASKEAVLAALAVRHREVLFASLEACEETEDPVERLRSCVHVGLSAAEGGGALFAVYLQMQSVIEAQIKAIGGLDECETSARFQRIVAAAYADGVRRGRFREGVSAQRFASTLCAAINLEMIDWAQGPRTDSLTERGQAVLDLLLNGAMS